MTEAFIEWNPTTETQLLLGDIAGILSHFGNLGYRLTVRQLYYQLVSQDRIPNTIQSYKRIMNVVSKGRLAGYINWRMIEDRVRIPSYNSHWESPKEILETAADSLYLDRWKGQKNYIEVWCEKDAVSNIIQPVCSQYDVLFMANRGYSSQSAMYDAYQRYKDKEQEEKEIYLIYLGDHDPSGLDMTRDVGDRLGRMLFFSGYFADEALPFENVLRVALTMDQIQQYQPPENPAKKTDVRYEKYAMDHGGKSWELDALDPQVLSKIVETAILHFLDRAKFDAIVAEEDQMKYDMSASIQEMFGDEE